MGMLSCTAQSMPGAMSIETAVNVFFGLALSSLSPSALGTTVYPSPLKASGSVQCVSVRNAVSMCSLRM